jgi:galactokinase
MVRIGSGLLQRRLRACRVAGPRVHWGSAELAALGQQAEQIVSGVPWYHGPAACGGRGRPCAAHGLHDRRRLVPVPAPQFRTLAGSAYGERRAACERAAASIGPLLDATVTDTSVIADPTVRRRARHVITENARVLAFAEAFRGGDLVAAGTIMGESHTSLRDDFEVSTPVLDALVERLTARPGVFGARLTGAGFGGCVVALAEPGALDEGWTVRASAGARLLAP